MTSLSLPDVAAQSNQQALPLDWVGMNGIAVALQLDGRTVTAFADAGVSLDDGASRGIHMSRLYLALEALEQQPLSPPLLRHILRSFLLSHTGLSNNAYLRLTFDHLLKRSALISPLAGWKRYPVTVDAKLEDEMFHVELSVNVPYSSTCPCSAALARQLIQEQFDRDFAHRPLDRCGIRQWLGSSDGIVATPHSQRSMARLQVRRTPCRGSAEPDRADRCGGSRAGHRSADRSEARRRAGFCPGQWTEPDVLRGCCPAPAPGIDAD